MAQHPRGVRRLQARHPPPQPAQQPLLQLPDPAGLALQCKRQLLNLRGQPALDRLDLHQHSNHVIMLVQLM